LHDVELAARVPTLREADHEPGAHQRFEHCVALGSVEPADFGCASDADFISGRHRKQQFLQFVETRVDDERSPHFVSVTASLHALARGQAMYRSAIPVFADFR
jgi:hypothetical protein